MQRHVNYATNLFVFFGIYYCIETIWKLIEMWSTGTYIINTKDTIIALFITMICYFIYRILKDKYPDKSYVFVIPKEYYSEFIDKYNNHEEKR